MSVAAQDSAVRIAGLAFGYEGKAGEREPFRLQIAELELAQGSRVACTGASGSGKTTLANLIAGIDVPQAGEVWLHGTRISHASDAERRRLRARNIGLVFQEFELLDYLSALDNVLLPYRVSRALRLTGAVRARALALLKSVGLSSVARRGPRQLAHGERQRVALCRALITQPRLVICDEPTGNLDAHASAELLDLCFEQCAEHGATLLLFTHDQACLPRFERILEMQQLTAGAGEQPA